jgi:hypothetical protein
MSKEEWVLLTPQQQMEARMKQADLNRANAERRAQQAAARRQRYAAMEAEERRRIEELYRSSRYGDVLECVIHGGTARFHSREYAYTPIPFTLARGEIKSVTLAAGNRRGKFWAQYSPDGLSMNLCYRKPGRHGSRYCVSVNGQSSEFSAGISQRVSVKRIFRDARVVCAHRPERDMPLVYVQRHDSYVYRVIHRHHYKSRARRTPVVIHNHYSRPAPRQRSKTVIHKHYHRAPDAKPRQRVIHKHYHEAPEPRSTKKVIHKHYYESPERQRARRPDREEPRRRGIRERYRNRPASRTQEAPDHAEPPVVEERGDAAPVSRIPDHARSPRAHQSRRTVQKARAVEARKKRHRRKRAKGALEEETLTSAPGKDKKRGRRKHEEE